MSVVVGYDESPGSEVALETLTDRAKKPVVRTALEEVTA